MMPAIQLQSSLAEHVEQIRTRGYTTIESVLTADQVARAAAALDRILDYEKQHGDRILWDNPFHQVSHVLIAKDKVFRELCLTPKLLEFARLVIGQDCVIGSVNGFTPNPGGSAQQLHPDRLLPKGFIGSITVALTLDEFTRENGCTRVIPYSHEGDVLSCLDKSFGDEELETQTIDLEAPPGAVIAYNSSLVHGAGKNCTQKRRRCVHLSFVKPWIQPEWDFPSSLTEKLVSDLTEEERKLYGFSSHPMKYNAETFSHRSKERRDLRYYVRRLKSKFFTSR